MIDFRTDSSSRPTDAMRRAMAEAEVGNDAYGEDPTVNRLEALAAQRFGKESALLVTSGTMGNLLAILAFAQRGEEIIAGEASHIANHEAGGSSVWGGVAYRTLPETSDAIIDPDRLEAAIRRRDSPLTAAGRYAPTVLVALENTHNVLGGIPLSAKQTRSIADVAHRNDVAVHVDGARIFHAEIALATPVADLVADVDSVSFAITKSLGCPVGSILCGDRSLIDKARRLRTTLGGQMRQAGILAAAGIVALDTMVERLAEDHVNALRLAEGLSQIPGICLEPAEIRTNLVYVEVTTGNSAQLAQKLQEQGISGPNASTRWRFATYHDIAAEDIDVALEIIETTFRRYGQR
jgi:threonine aldolase